MNNIALIGYGYWGQNLARVLNETGALAAIVDVLPRHLEEARAAYPEVKVMASFEQALAEPQIRAICIATPAVTHASLAVAAMQRGKDVFVEKPMCLNLVEAQRMINIAREQRAILMVGHLLLYHPAVLKLNSLIDAGAFGKLLYVSSNRMNIGRIRSEENIFWSFAPHDVSVINHLLGEFPEAALAVGRDFLTPGVQDTTVSHLRYPSGVQAPIQGTKTRGCWRKSDGRLLRHLQR